jgi:hypothetical protein
MRVEGLLRLLGLSSTLEISQGFKKHLVFSLGHQQFDNLSIRMRSICENSLITARLQLSV